MRRLPKRRDCARWLAGLLLLVGLNAHAALRDEILVYDDELLRAGERAVELHVNRTLSARVPAHAGQLRVMPEFAWGLGRDVELGLHLPTVRESPGDWRAAGARLRLKWLPIGAHGDAHDAGYREGGAWFAGINLELSRVQTRYEDPAWSSELRGIIGWRGGPWVLSFNPVVYQPFTRGTGGTPQLLLGARAMREIRHGASLGFEYHGDRGPLWQPLPRGQQDRIVYLVGEFEVGRSLVHVGVGRGATRASDPWTLKTMIGFPF